MPGKGPVQRRLLEVHGPFGHLGPRAAHEASMHAIHCTRRGRDASAVVNDVINGRQQTESVSSEDSLEDYMEYLTEDDSVEEETSQGEGSGSKASNNQEMQDDETEDNNEQDTDGEEHDDEQDTYAEDDENETAQYNLQFSYYAPTPMPASSPPFSPVTAGTAAPAVIFLAPIVGPAAAAAVAAASNNLDNAPHCPHCDKEFNNAAAQRQHVLDRHVGTTCYWPDCLTVTATEAELSTHFHEHQRSAVARGWNPLHCPWPNCGKEFSRRYSVQRCFKKHNLHASRG
ncbi:hypothetical protein CIB48_g3675 [Xylaria polymorpha]|nr:hypothetical protein CIB48_g3675 [Xylaria polymorpha]